MRHKTHFTAKRCMSKLQVPYSGEAILLDNATPLLLTTSKVSTVTSSRREWTAPCLSTTISSRYSRFHSAKWLESMLTHKLHTHVVSSVHFSVCTKLRWSSFFTKCKGTECFKLKHWKTILSPILKLLSASKPTWHTEQMQFPKGT